MSVRSTRLVDLGSSRLTVCSGRRGFAGSTKRRATPSAESQRPSPAPPSPPLTNRSHSGQDAASRLSASLRIRNKLNILETLFSDPSPLRFPLGKERIQRAGELVAQTSSHTGAQRPLRIGVVGTRDSGTSQLVTALLDEPLVESAELRRTNEPVDRIDAVGRRYERRTELHPKLLRIFHDEFLGASEDEHHFAVPHPWLRDQHIEIIELLDPEFNDYTIGELYSCDSLFFVSDAALLSARSRFAGKVGPDSTLQLLDYFADKPGTRLVINHAPGFVKGAGSSLEHSINRDTLDVLEGQTRRTSSGVESALLDVSLDEAIAANEALRQALTSSPATSSDSAARAWEDFATLYNSSGVRQIKSLMERPPLETALDEKEPFQEAISVQTALFAARHALDEAGNARRTVVELVNKARGAANVLQRDAQSQEESWMRSLFLLPASETRPETSESRVHQRSGDRSKRVEGSVRDSRGVVEKSFASRLAWWRIWWRVDDVRAEMETAISKSFARDLESQLRFEAGKLLYYSQKLNDNLATYIASLKQTNQSDAEQTILTPTLLNALRADSTEEVATRLNADILSRPIEERRKLLLAQGGPIDVLSARAQRAVLSSVTLVGGAGITSVVGTIASSPWSSALPATLSHMAMLPSTAGGLFAFATVASAWILQSRWARAKKKFWRDWESVANGLDDDLRINFHEAFRSTAAAQSHTASRELLRVAAEREEALRGIENLWQRVKDGGAHDNKQPLS